jgi:hypothetical protein
MRHVNLTIRPLTTGVKYVHFEDHLLIRRLVWTFRRYETKHAESPFALCSVLGYNERIWHDQWVHSLALSKLLFL